MYFLEIGYVPEREYMMPIHLNAGEAIIFDHALAHASKPNKTNEIRIAATNSIISEEAEYRFYFNNCGIVEEYIGEPHYYVTEEAKTGAGNLKKIKDLDFKMMQLDEEQFYKLYEISIPKKVKSEYSLWGKIKSKILS
jgi:hypothetical protein